MVKNKMKKLNLNVTTKGMHVLLWAIVVFIVVDMLAKFKLIDLSGYVTPIFIPTVAALFILFEIGIMQVIQRKKKLDGIQAFGMAIAVIALVTVVLYIIGITATQLMTIQGIVDLALGIFVVIEIFKK